MEKAVKVVNKIDELKAEGKTEEATKLEDTLNTQSVNKALKMAEGKEPEKKEPKKEEPTKQKPTTDELLSSPSSAPKKEEPKKEEPTVGHRFSDKALVTLKKIENLIAEANEYSKAQGGQTITLDTWLKEAFAHLEKEMQKIRKKHRPKKQKPKKQKSALPLTEGEFIAGVMSVLRKNKEVA
jgi:hypothetical protein